ncbi:TPA: DUF1566 domain-containing protein [Stenotrophomonas maltophilia]|nr:DUF1566 domain-containing protein [Stenotrophomonas maltophilia]
MIRFRPIAALGAGAALTFLAAALPVLAAEAIGVLPDTGQTTCFDPGYGAVPCDESTTGDASALPRQDARFGRDALAAMGRLLKVGGGEFGFDYSRLCMNGDVEGTDACPLNPPVPADLDHPAPSEWACLRDNVTGLVWSLGGRTLMSWADASSTTPGSPIQLANASARCGLGANWRLPVRREGFSLMHFGRQVPALDPAYFPVLASDYLNAAYWTTDVDASSPNLNHMLAFVWAGANTTWCRERVPGDALCDRSPAPNGRFDAHVLLVNGAWHRAAATGSQTRWRVREDGLAITDTATGLTWDRCTWGQAGPTCDGQAQLFRHWNDAMQVTRLANQMRYRGYDDWRVPNARELETLVKIDAARPAIDSILFPNTAQEMYWTATEMPEVPTISMTVVGVHFRDGVVGGLPKEVNPTYTPDRSPIRLVRGGSPYGMVDGIGERLHVGDFDDAPLH